MHGVRFMSSAVVQDDARTGRTPGPGGARSGRYRRGVDPALPAEPTPDPYADASSGVFEASFDAGPAVSVGDYRQGTAGSRWALARYLVGRAVGESIGNSLLVIALVILVLAALVQWAGSTGWAVLIVLVALAVLTMRALLRAILRRLTAVDQFGPVEARVRSIVADTRGDVMRELRRIGVPSHTWTLPLLAWRLIRRKRRAETLARLRSFDVEHVVPRARVDELHLLLRGAVQG